MDKRGVSGVVISILLVLISIAAIAIIGAFILAFIRTNTEKVESGINQVNIKIVENSLKYSPPELILKVKRNPGVGNLSGLSIIIAGENGKSATYKYDGSVEELETKQISVPISSFEPVVDKISKVSIAPITTVQSGNKYTGEVKDEEVPSSRFLGNNGLIGYWSFDNDQGNVIKDDSGNNNNGFCDSCPIKVSGKKGFGYEFNGSSLVGINFSFSPTLQVQEFSVVAWVYPKQVPIGVGRVIINAYKYYGSSNQKGWILGYDYGIEDFIFTKIYNTGTSSGATYSNFFNEYNNNWTQVVGTYKPGSYVRTYINGGEKMVETTSGVSSSIVYDSSVLLRIGARSDNPYQGMWNGTIDEVRIYNRSLSANEVYYLYKYN